jgi:hypothetical protein
MAHWFLQLTPEQKRTVQNHLVIRERNLKREHRELKSQLAKINMLIRKTRK